MRFLISLLLLLLSVLLSEFYNLKTVLISSALIIVSYNVFYKIILIDGFEKKLKGLFSLTYVISYFLIVLIVKQSLELGSIKVPYLPGDGLTYYQLGEKLALSNVEVTTIALNYVGYPLVLSYMFKIFGTDLIFGFILNQILLFLNIILISKVSFEITKNKKTYVYSFLILILTSQFMATGFMLLKDGFIILSISLSLIASLRIYNGRSNTINFIILGVAFIIMALFRFTYVWVPILIFFTLNFKTTNKFIGFPIVVVLFMGGIYFGKKMALTDRTVKDNIEFAVSNKVISQRLNKSSGSFVAGFISNYDNWSVVRKISFLPITTAIQFAMPFNFYEFNNSFRFSYYFVSRNYNVVWYLFVGPLLLFTIYFFVLYRSKLDYSLKRLFFLGVILYVMPAFIFGGTIPRYSIVFFSLLVPLMALVFFNIKQNQILKKKWKRFLLRYYYMIFIFLIIYLSYKIFV